MNNIKELDNSVLENTPILFFINEENQNLFKSNLKAILERGDVIFEQLFFCLDSALSCSKMQRIIGEIGINSPQILTDNVQVALERYFEIYPKTAYIQRIIGILRGVHSDIGAVLKADGEKNIDINSNIHQMIDSIENTINKLKKPADQISHKNNFELPEIFNTNISRFKARVMNWNTNKIKINSIEEAGAKSAVFQSELDKLFKKFINRTKRSFEATEEEIRQNFAELHASAEFSEDYVSSQATQIDLTDYQFPTIIEKLLSLKEERMVKAANIVGSVVEFFGGAKQEVQEELVVEFKYDDWRNCAIETAEPILDEITKAVLEKLTDFYKRVADDYLENLKMRIEQQTDEKDKISAQLSDDEKKFQEDMDWFSSFQEKLRQIERG